MALLKSLERQENVFPVHLWLDGHHGHLKTKIKTDYIAGLVKKNFPLVRLIELNGNIGIEKMTIDGLSYMCDRYERIIVLEDDCFPTRDAVNIFSKDIEYIEKKSDIYSVYGHYFLTPSEGRTITRFQGWGWASTCKKILPVLENLKDCFAMPEEKYLQWVKQNLTPEIRGLLDVTHPRNCLIPLNSFFCWDSCTCLLTALAGLKHMKTSKRVIYNCGIGHDSTHFPDKQKFRNPPYNMISIDEVWNYF